MILKCGDTSKMSSYAAQVFYKFTKYSLKMSNQKDMKKYLLTIISILCDTVQDNQIR